MENARNSKSSSQNEERKGKGKRKEKLENNIFVLENEKLQNLSLSSDELNEWTSLNEKRELNHLKLKKGNESIGSFKYSQNKNINELHKAIILKCDTFGTLNVLKNMILGTQKTLLENVKRKEESLSLPVLANSTLKEDGNDSDGDEEGDEKEEEKEREIARVQIVQSGIGSITRDDIEFAEQINESKYDECRIYVFNGEMTNDAWKYWNSLEKEEKEKEKMEKKSEKRAKYHPLKDARKGEKRREGMMRHFDVFYEMEEDIKNWFDSDAILFFKKRHR